MTITASQKKEVRELFSGKRNPDNYVSVQNWVRRCYHPPSLHERRMEAANEILGGYGVEAIGDNPMRPRIEYINMGDTYRETLLYIRSRKRPIVWGCWGDYVG